MPRTEIITHEKRRAHRVNDAAKILGISRSTAYAWMKTGTLAFVDVCGIRLVPDAAIERLLSPRSDK